ncbi:MAG: hypothetical protein KME21_00770 [Desmonostoc vinosum HA7617-LM4]|jgi:hypothetical protein|nr:hypothetical protein [Desmonostoc vinosum HA7617-LM4]
MTLFDVNYSAILKRSIICLLAVAGASNFLAIPASAGQQGAARSAATVTRPTGLTESVAGEVLVPNGYYFQGIPAVPTTPAVPPTPPTQYYNSGGGAIPVPPGATLSTCGGNPCYQPSPGSPFYAVFLSGGTPGSAEIPGTPGKTLVITPNYANGGQTNQSLTGLSFNAGTPTATSTSGTVAGAVVDILQGDNSGVKAPTVDDAAAIIKAAASTEGLE